MGEPKLRFKADDGSDFPDWEEMTLGDVGSVAMCKRVFKEQTCEVGDVPFFKIGTFGGAPDAYISQSLFDELKSKYAYPKVGTILLSASGTIGRQVEYKGEDAYYQDSNIVWLEHDDTVLDSYLKQFYSVVKWQGLEGSTIKRLYNKTVLDTPFYRPSLPEQRKIADCLSAVDAVIAAQQAEVDAWEQRKKGVMQKLFSQEVRFKADDGSDFPDWTKTRLNKLCEYRTNRGTGRNYIGTENMLKDFEGVAVENGESEGTGSLYEPGDTLMSNIRPYLKKVWTADCEGACSTDVLVFHPTNVVPDFLHYVIASDSFVTYVMSAAKGSKMPRGDKAHIMQMPVFAPDKDEQRKIADCLASMDEVIQKSKGELAKWQELKKGLLQQMFV
ncbi:MAG TPA: restriction endonuclease subunit S [Bifidobacterium pseudolongum subsp. globosum]|uniref:restriction endonuclease subunit S n=1 Tax=Bifidobacterium pseudolongum TaxID=1694 RepID=UPI001D7A6E4F|nr:restriction endonuclease subunit S [Bifidobacterium pseudolongum]HJE56876.1 restriction endonuclease subunit S [Bifidobacterium pseudolongum subsp. globosum]